MRIAFLGTPEFTLPILEACAKAGELALVVAQPDRPVGRSGRPQSPPSVTWARERGIRVEQPEKVKQGRLAAVLASARPDVAIVAAYGRILPADALAVPRHGCLNAHARPAHECDQRRRGFTPWPGAWTTLGGGILKIHEAEPILQSANQPFGEIVKTGPDGLYVACAGSVWRLIELQLEGKKRLAAGPFIA